MKRLLKAAGIATLVAMGLVCGGVCLLSLVVPAGNLALSGGLALVSGWACKTCFEAAVAVAR